MRQEVAPLRYIQKSPEAKSGHDSLVNFLVRPFYKKRREVMNTKLLILVTILGLMAACSNDDGPPTKQPGPVQRPEPEQEPENQPPGSFALLTPEMDNKVTARTPNLTWVQATDPDGDSVFYDVYLDTEGNPATLIAENLNSTIFSVPEDLDLKTEYHWKVVARDGNGAITESTVNSFTTEYPIVFLKEFSRTFDTAKLPERTQFFKYANSKLTELDDGSGVTWSTAYDISLGKLTRLNRPIGGELLTYIYSYAAQGSQENITLGRSAKKESWAFAYDGQGRLASITFESTGGTEHNENSKADFVYADAETSDPLKILSETVRTDPTNPDQLDRFEATLELEWERRNIRQIRWTISENGSPENFRTEYTYDNNINPYHTLITQQFGWDNFFVSNVSTGMESIDFGFFFWQSPNNMTKIEQQSPKEESLIVTEQYIYGYSEKYYPLTAILKSRGEMSESESEISWSY